MRIPGARVALYSAVLVLAATGCAAQTTDLDGRWTVALELGELPLHGSFKLGVSAGYQWNEHAWFGLAWQMPDEIRRGGSSFNAEATGLEGLVGTQEEVGQRAYLHARIRPHRYAPHLSVGLVYNARDTEIMRYDDRVRTADGTEASGSVTIRSSRRSAVRPALGAGYAWTSPEGITVFAEWSGWWLRGAPQPEVAITAAGADPAFVDEVDRRLREHFTSSVFNTWHIFQMGVGISW